MGTSMRACATWLLLIVVFAAAACLDEEREGEDVGLGEDGGAQDGVTEMYGRVWPSIDPCGEYEGPADPVSVQMLRITEQGIETPMEGCEGDYQFGDYYRYVLSAGGSFRLKAADATGMYRLSSKFSIPDGDSFEHDIIPVCMDWMK